MEAHNFDELLSQVAEPAEEGGKGTGGNGEGALRWYLKDTADQADAAESAKEDASAALLEKFMAKRLKGHPDEEGVHYSDLFEHFIYAVKDKPRRALADWLPDYFYKTPAGTWRLPESDEEKKLKADARKGGVLRRVKRYLSFLQQGVPVPAKDRPTDATLASWIRHCKRSGLFEQGKLLYEKGGLDLDNLSEEAMVAVEEDYQVCSRSVAGAAVHEKKHARRKTRQLDLFDED
jgi:hypothetical protein